MSLVSDFNLFLYCVTSSNFLELAAQNKKSRIFIQFDVCGTTPRFLMSSEVFPLHYFHTVEGIGVNVALHKVHV